MAPKKSLGGVQIKSGTNNKGGSRAMSDSLLQNSPGHRHSSSKNSAFASNSPSPSQVFQSMASTLCLVCDSAIIDGDHDSI